MKLNKLTLLGLSLVFAAITLQGCSSSTSSNANSASPISSEHKQTVLTQAGDILDKVLSDDEGETYTKEKVSSSNTIAKKATFENGEKDFNYEKNQYKNKNGNVYSTQEEWKYELTSTHNQQTNTYSGVKEFYSSETFSDYKIESHHLSAYSGEGDNESDNYTQNGTISKMDATITYDSGVIVKVTNGTMSWSESKKDGVKSEKGSINFPITIQMDADGNGNQEIYTTTLIASDIDPESDETSVSVTVYDEDGREVGSVTMTNDGIKLSPAS